MRTLLLALILINKAHAGESDCLARIMYAEARGEPFEGVVAIGQAVVNRSTNRNKPICKLTGVQKKQPPLKMLNYYKSIAKELLKNPSTSIVSSADSWNTGRKPAYPGKVNRQINKHIFYTMD